jgi:hypothetical protein
VSISDELFGEDLKPGASNEDDHYHLSGPRLARLAEDILATPEEQILQEGVELAEGRRPRGGPGLPEGYADPRHKNYQGHDG